MARTDLYKLRAIINQLDTRKEELKSLLDATYEIDGLRAALKSACDAIQDHFGPDVLDEEIAKWRSLL